MDTSHPIWLAVVYGAYSAVTVMIVSLVAMALINHGLDLRAFIEAGINGLVFFLMGIVTVRFVWPRIGFRPFGNHTTDTTAHTH